MSESKFEIIGENTNLVITGEQVRMDYVPPPKPPFFHDTFTDTDRAMTSHIPEIGSWNAVGASRVYQNRLGANASNAAFMPLPPLSGDFELLVTGHFSMFSNNLVTLYFNRAATTYDSFNHIRVVASRSGTGIQQVILGSFYVRSTINHPGGLWLTNWGNPEKPEFKLQCRREGSILYVRTRLFDTDAWTETYYDFSILYALSCTPHTGTSFNLGRQYGEIKLIDEITPGEWTL